MRHTQIICTIGPASWDPAVMKQMIEAGMNVARVNGAFADTAELDKVTKLVRDVSRDVKLMMDVKGPEVRMNKFTEPIKLHPGMPIDIGSTTDAAIYPANYPEVYKFVHPGQDIVVGDGDVQLEVESISDGVMHCSVTYGEELKPGKALNFPGVRYTSDVLTPKDIENLKHAQSLGWEFVSASFIQNAEAARTIRNELNGSQMRLIAKIEDQEGVNNIDQILAEVDGIMVARGGLGVELGLEKVPMVQRHLIKDALLHNKPAIAATQMLESIIYNPRPTRAEVNDVATAVLLGASAVMLSGETSAGKYPVEAVKWMAKIIDEIEKTHKLEILVPHPYPSLI